MDEETEVMHRWGAEKVGLKFQTSQHRKLEWASRANKTARVMYLVEFFSTRTLHFKSLLGCRAGRRPTARQ